MVAGIRTFAFVGLVFALSVLPARAQIYVAHDASGGLILSDRPVAEATHTYAVQHSTVRTTRPIAPGVSTTRFDDVIEEASARHGVRPELVRAVIQQESGFNPRARSRVGAMGLMQLMPATASELGVADPWDPVQNIHGGVAYLGSLLQQFGSETLALAAYNAGPGAVLKYGQQIPPYRETRDYVRRITSRTGTMAVRSGQPRLYKVLVEIDGREQWQITDTQPRDGYYEVIR